MALAVFLMVLLAASGCAAREFYVGGRDGWTTNPGEPHNQWAERNRFQVNDTLVFRYKEDADGVLRVTQSHYDACNTSEPILRLDSRFVFPDSGPYFFISADASRCKAGERLIVVVLAVRSPPLPPTPPPAPKPASSSFKSAPPPPSPKPSSPQPAPKPSSSSSAPPPPPTPPVPSPTPSAGNVSSPSPAPLTAPVSETTGTYTPPSRSSAVALRAAAILACLIAAGSTIL